MYMTSLQRISIGEELQKRRAPGHQWLILVILATWEAEIRRIEVRG
jgi:allantoicase